MITVGEKLELKIEDVVYRGPGLARHEGMIIFVNRVAPGERVEVEITKRKKNFASADLLRVLEPSPARIPACTSVSTGDSVPGCVYDFLDYAVEVEIKQRQMLSLLRHVPDIQTLALAPFASPRSLHYRNKIVLHAQRTGRDLASIGYYGKDKRIVVDLESCPLAREAINFAWATQRDAARRTMENGQRITLRWTQADGVSSWVDHAPEDSPMLTETNPVGPLKVPMDGFYQVNEEVAEALVLQVRDWFVQAAAGNSYNLLDLYCGVGVFALNCAAAGATHVLGIESVRTSIAAARLNSRELKHPATFRCARVEDAARIGFGDADLSKTIVIADPPRQGIEPGVLTTLGNGRVPHLIYVACDPATLARDLKLLAPFGYHLRAVRMFDMFPRTQHFETAVWLSLEPQA